LVQGTILDYNVHCGVDTMIWTPFYIIIQVSLHSLKPLTI